MPSGFDLRRRLGLRPSTQSPSKQQLPVLTPRYISPDPAQPRYVSIAQRQLRLYWTVPLTRCSSGNNHAFQLALEQHIQTLDPDEKAAFTQADQSIHPNDLLREVDRLDAEDRQKSIHRRYVDKISNVFELCNRCMNIVAVGSQTSPEGSLIVGAIKLVIGVYLLRLPSFDTCGLTPCRSR